METRCSVLVWWELQLQLAKKGGRRQHLVKRQVKMTLEGLSDSLKLVKGEIFYENILFPS